MSWAEKSSKHSFYSQIFSRIFTHYTRTRNIFSWEEACTISHCMGGADTPMKAVGQLLNQLKAGWALDTLRIFTLDCSDLLKNVSFDWRKIVSFVKITDPLHINDYKHVNGTDIEWSIIPSGYPTCQLVDLKKIIEKERLTPHFILIYFNKVENLGISIKIVDRNRGLRKRGLRSTQAKNYDGSNVDVDDLLEPTYKSFFLTLSQIIYLETKSGFNCRNYPNNEFNSYQECDEHFVYNEMRNKHKIMPFWAAKTLDEVTTLTHYHFDRSNYTSSPYYGLMTGIDESSCPLPCKITKVLKF